MTRNEHYESEYNIEDDIFGFFEFFLFSSRDQYEPTSVDDQEDTDDGEERVEICKNLANNRNPSSQVHLLDVTRSSRRESSGTILTTRSTIKCLHYRIWYTYKKKPDNCVEDGVFGFFALLLIATS